MPSSGLVAVNVMVEVFCAKDNRLERRKISVVIFFMNAEIGFVVRLYNKEFIIK